MPLNLSLIGIDLNIFGTANGYLLRNVFGVVCRNGKAETFLELLSLLLADSLWMKEKQN